MSGLPFKYKIYEIVVSVIFVGKLILVLLEKNLALFTEKVLTQYKLLIP